MKFIKFTIVYLLVFVSLIAFRLSYLETEALYAYGEAIGGITNLLIVFITFLSKDGSSDHDSIDDIDIDA